MVQGELFIDEKNDLRTQSPSFFSAHKISLTLDKIILISIAFLILFALTFSFGYERGKRAAERKIQALTSHIETIPSIPVPTAPPILNEQPTDVEEAMAATPVTATATSHTSSETLDAAAGFPTDATSTVLATDSEKSTEIPIESGKYTIQIATADSKEKAEKEVAKLEKKGQRAFFLQRGKFFEVCVGSFETVKSSKPLLAEIKEVGPYKDAFVRPLH